MIRALLAYRFIKNFVPKSPKLFPKFSSSSFQCIRQYHIYSYTHTSINTCIDNFNKKDYDKETKRKKERKKKKKPQVNSPPHRLYTQAPIEKFAKKKE